MVVLFVVMWAVAAFMANRLYVIIRYREINVKGVVYSRDGTPIIYWVEMVLIIIGLLLTGGIAMVSTIALALNA